MVPPRSSTSEQDELPKGALGMLVLKTLSVQPMHGYGIAQHIQRLSGGVFSVEHGSLYPALARLQKNGWITSKLATSPTGRRARYYTITASGRKQLGERESTFARVIGAIESVMRGG